MPVPPGSSISQFVDAYHLWSPVLLLCLLGAYEFLHLTSYLLFRLLGDFAEDKYNCKTRVIETKRRYAQIANESARTLSRSAGAD